MRTNAAPIPTAAKIPKSAMAVTGLNTLVRKPTAVVTVARTRATPTVLVAFEAAPLTSSPPPTSSRYRAVRWIA